MRFLPLVSAADHPTAIQSNVEVYGAGTAADRRPRAEKVVAV
jgi:hypothetical protein